MERLRCQSTLESWDQGRRGPPISKPRVERVQHRAVFALASTTISCPEVQVSPDVSCHVFGKVLSAAVNKLNCKLDPLNQPEAQDAAARLRSFIVLVYRAAHSSIIKGNK